MRSDGKVVGSNTYRGENAVGKFLSDVLREEEKIRESFATPEPIVMTWKDWIKFNKATDCHICNKILIKDEFMDSLPVWNFEEEPDEEGVREKWVYGGKATKNVSTWHRKRRRSGDFKS